jgi:hypothetical protein
MSSARLGAAVGWYVFRVVLKPGPGCVVTAVSGTGSGDYTLTIT